MNIKIKRDNFPGAARIVALLLLAGIFFAPPLRAQPAEATVQSRFLFIFDTSKEMKPRVEAVQKTLNTLLATSLNGQLHTGDSIGVWTFGQELRTRDYPLQSWNPDAAAVIASNLTKFVSEQRYARAARYELLQPLLNRVMQGSERLTVLVFCDGEGKISGTPYDAAIHQVFTNKFGEQKKAREPLVVLLRSQLGEYVGCTVTLSPQMVSTPPFPPLPQPPPPAPVTPPATIFIPPPAPVVTSPPLIIIGKKVVSSLPPPATNPPPKVEPVVPVLVSNAPAAIIIASNPVVAKMVVATPTNVPAPAVIPKIIPMPAPALVPTPATVPVALPKNSEAGNNLFLLAGAGLLGLAIVLAITFAARSRRKDTSLITRSMNDPQ